MSTTATPWPSRCFGWDGFGFGPGLGFGTVAARPSHRQRIHVALSIDGDRVAVPSKSDRARPPRRRRRGRGSGLRCPSRPSIGDDGETVLIPSPNPTHARNVFRRAMAAPLMARWPSRCVFDYFEVEPSRRHRERYHRCGRTGPFRRPPALRRRSEPAGGVSKPTTPQP